MDVEICVNSSARDYVFRSVSASYEGGAARIELCGDMSVGGITPEQDHILAAREAFQERKGLLCMIRPRGGDFFFSSDEVILMLQQIEMAAQSGADGVVIGTLSSKTGKIDVESVSRLLERARHFNLQVTFHRAFDATVDVYESLDTLMELGVNRVLTSGTAWDSSKGAVEGISVLSKLSRQAGSDIEIVVGGGVSPENAGSLVTDLSAPVSVHAYSSVLEKNEVSVPRVEALLKAVN